MVILLPLRTREDVIKDQALKEGPKVCFRIGNGEDGPSAERTLSTKEAILVYGSVSYRTEPPVPLLALPRPTRPKVSAPAE